MTTRFAVIASVAAVSACGAADNRAEVGATLSDKSEVAIGDVPADVMAAARAVRPDLTFSEAEYEKKNGAEYYEVAGADANGEEIELDIMKDGAAWRVVEVQRDITMDETPPPVRDALLASLPGIEPARIIESDQQDGVIIYEVYTRDEAGKEAKTEVKFDGETATVLAEEWPH